MCVHQDLLYVPQDYLVGDMVDSASDVLGVKITSSVLQLSPPRPLGQQQEAPARTDTVAGADQDADTKEFGNESEDPAQADK